MKRSLLGQVLDKVILNHDRKTLLHTLDIYLRIPLVLSQKKKGDTFGAPFNISSKPLKIQEDQLSTRSLYSTVVNFSSKIPNQSNYSNGKGYFLTMVIQVTSSNLWTSPYNDYQQEVFDIIRSKHEDEGLNFVQISDWLNENKYLTPRGKVFTQPHAWSIYTKKKRSMKRFSREYDPEVINTGVDVVNYVPDP